MSNSPENIEASLERILPQVQKPGRYVGGEFNQVIKPWDKITTHLALAFPDIYNIGLPNLGLAILYDLINQRSDALAERVYSPWSDMEEHLRQENIPLFSLESKHAIADFDILGITLPYETLYTNTLNLLDLAGLPLRCADRDASHPLVIAGGHATFNPEPMSPFIDAFIIGDGEGIIHDIIECHQRWKSSGSRRTDLLEQLAAIQGIYVPAFYEPDYKPDGTIALIEKEGDQTPFPVYKHFAAELPPPLTRFLVPSIDIVHNRIAVEIMRGCSRGCRFCQAGMISRPIRERSIEEILAAIQQGLDSTGFEEIALLSLSSSDHSRILELVEAIGEQFCGRHLVISLPSLRIETFSVDLLEQLKGTRQGGFTLAPEAATERMQHIINKHISAEQLLKTAEEIYSRGWTTIKLYFMIGHPSETLEDVRAIAELCKSVINVGRRVIGKRATLRAGVSTFVPKPHTPFQWASCDTTEQIEAKQRLLKQELRGPGLKLNWTDPAETMLESWLARGDRRMAEVIYSAWKHGARFDAWREHFNPAAWETAFNEHNLDPGFYTHRKREENEIFPWDHIHAGVDKSFLLHDYKDSLEGVLRADCSEQCSACGILSHYSDIRTPAKELWKCP